MNIVGYEFDIVRKDPKTGEYTSVPGWEQYNHHYGECCKSTITINDVAHIFFHYLHAVFIELSKFLVHAREFYSRKGR